MPALPPLQLLHPQPKEIQSSGAGLRIGPGGRVVVRTEGEAGRRAQQRLRSHPRFGDGPPGGGGRGAGAAPAGSLPITMRIAARATLPATGYCLRVSPEGIDLEGRDAAGLFHGACTAAQLLELCSDEVGGGSLPGVVIRDWPDLPHRGVMLDVSRDKVPTMRTLLDLVDLLAGWKINELQLYMEHTFAYRGHEVVWRGASPFTGDEIRTLDAFCRERFIELIPNQNSFGHMHRWLIHEPYRALAESPDGIEHPFSRSREPYSLCPTDPASLELLADLYDQLLPHFESRRFNVGLDETFDLGCGRSAAVCGRVGRDRVYLDFLKKVHGLVRDRGCSVQFWSDIVRASPALIGELPPDVTALDWGYEADHPFEASGRQLRDAGLDYYVCPGTSSWNSIAGRTDNAIANVRRAAESARSHGAIGLMVTDWGDRGHLQPLPVSYLGLLVAAGFGWNAASGSLDARAGIAALLDAHVFRDRASRVGRLAYDLGNAYRRFGPPRRNSSPLFDMLIFPERAPAGAGGAAPSAAAVSATRAAIDAALADLGGARMERADAELIGDEFRWAADLLRSACRIAEARLGAAAQAPLSAVARSRRAPIARDISGLIERHRELWSRRNRPGGLEDSVAWLGRALPALSA